MKILSWNIQGGFKDIMRRELIVEMIRDTSANIVMIQEPGSLDQDTMAHIRRILRLTFGEIKVIYQRFNCRYGGILTIVTKDWVHRVKKVIWDPKSLARYHAIQFRGKQAKTITVINTYRPHFKSTGLHSVAEYQRMRLELNDAYSSIEESYEQDIRNSIFEELREGHEVILTGDINKRTSDEIQLWETMELASMVNCLEVTLQIKNQPTRVPGEGAAIDHIYNSSGIQTLSGGILEKTTLSDHTPIWAQFSGLNVFYNVAPRVTRESRNVHSRKPKAVIQFRQHLEQEMRKHNIVNRLTQIEEEFDNAQELKETNADERARIIGYISKEYDNIVDTVDRCTIEADDKAAKKTKGNIILSKGEREIRTQILTWRKLLGWTKYKGQSKISSTQAKKLLRQVGKQEIHLASLGTIEVQQNLKDLWMKWRNLFESRYRKDQTWHLYEEAKHRKDMGDLRTTDDIIKYLKNMDKSNEMHRKIKQARQKQPQMAISMLEIDQQGIRRQITEKEEIEKLAIIECHKKVHAADSTPLYSKPLLTDLKLGEGPDEWEVMFNNGIIDESTMEYWQTTRGMKLFIKKLKTDHQAETKIDFTDEEYHAGWKKQKEKTSSMGRINFSHFQCVEPASLANIARAKISRFRLKTGITPTAYTKACDLLLLKKPNDFRAKGIKRTKTKWKIY